MILFRKTKSRRNSDNVSFKRIRFFHVGQFCELVGKRGSDLGQKCQGVSNHCVFSWLHTSGQLLFLLNKRLKKEKGCNVSDLELGNISGSYWQLTQSSVCFIQWGKAKGYFLPKSMCSFVCVRETTVMPFYPTVQQVKSKAYPQLLHPWVWLWACLQVPAF